MPPTATTTNAEDTTEDAGAGSATTSCAGCKAGSTGADNKFCGTCGAAFPPAKDGASDDEDKDEEDGEGDAKASESGVLFALTGRKSSKAAIAIIMGWKSAATETLPRMRATNVNLTIKALTAQKKCTPALEKDLRALATLSFAKFEAGAAALESGEPIAGLLPMTREPSAPGTSPTGALTHDGKTFEQLTTLEQHDLYSSNHALYVAMRDDADRRGAKR